MKFHYISHLFKVKFKIRFMPREKRNVIVTFVQQSIPRYRFPRSQVSIPSPSSSPMSNRKGKEEFGLWAVSSILWATHHHQQQQLLSMKYNKLLKSDPLSAQQEGKYEAVYMFKENIIKERVSVLVGGQVGNPESFLGFSLSTTSPTFWQKNVSQGNQNTCVWRESGRGNFLLFSCLPGDNNCH